MRYRLQTLLIVAALAPAVLAGLGSALFLGWAWSGGVPMGDDPAVLRAIESARKAPPWDPNSIEAKMTPAEWHEYSMMNESQKAAERHRLGLD